MVLYIKNMVCQRCILSVQHTLQMLQVPWHRVLLGEAHLCDELQGGQQEALERELNKLGFELIDSRKNQLIEQVKKMRG